MPTITEAQLKAARWHVGELSTALIAAARYLGREGNRYPDENAYADFLRKVDVILNEVPIWLVEDGEERHE
jgi:hypothetical protein